MQKLIQKIFVAGIFVNRNNLNDNQQVNVQRYFAVSHTAIKRKSIL